ncbi:MAG: zinc-dependent alcohol dehydrogenase [Candidatus Heimdallarchaeaceae archaeon]
MESEIVYFDPSIPKFLVSKIMKKLWKKVVLSRVGPITHKKNYYFELENPNEVLTKTLIGGICGTELHLIDLDFALNVTPTIVPSPSPRHMGHECVCQIVETGNEVSKLKKGDRVVVQKGPSCFLHQQDNLCPRCYEGDFWLCEKAGQFADFTAYHAAGGWGTGFKYHENQLISVPEEITNDQAILIEPLSCSLRGVLRAKPQAEDTVLIIGAGTIGLCTLASIKAINPDVNTSVMVKYDYQADAARKLGADEIIIKKNIEEYLEDRTNAVKYHGLFGNRTYIGGFDLIFDCVGTASTIQNSLRWVKGKGKVMVLGIDFKQGKLDYTPVWYQEVALLGSLGHGTEDWKGKKKPTFEIIIELLKTKKIPSTITEIITHRYNISNYKEAIKVAFNKRKNQAIKVIFDFEF